MADEREKVTIQLGGRSYTLDAPKGLSDDEVVRRAIQQDQEFATAAKSSPTLVRQHPDLLQAQMSAGPAPTMGERISGMTVPGTGKTLGEVGRDAKTLGKVALAGSMLVPGAEEVNLGEKILPWAAKQAATRIPGAVTGYELGKRYGGVPGSLAGGALGMIAPEMVGGAVGKIGKWFGRGMGEGMQAAAPAAAAKGESVSQRMVTPEGAIMPSRASAGSFAQMTDADLQTMSAGGDRGAAAELARRGKAGGGASKIDYSKIPLPKEAAPTMPEGRRLEGTFEERMAGTKPKPPRSVGAAGAGFTEEAAQGGHAGGGVASVEELSRTGKNYIVKPSGSVSYHGKSFSPEAARAGEAHVTVLPSGELRVNAGRMSPQMEKGLRSAIAQ